MTSNAVIDMLDQPLKEGDHVVSFNNIYVIKKCGNPGSTGHGSIRIILMDPSKTTRSKVVSSREVCKIDDAVIVTYKLNHSA